MMGNDKQPILDLDENFLDLTEDYDTVLELCCSIFPFNAILQDYVNQLQKEHKYEDLAAFYENVGTSEKELYSQLNEYREESMRTVNHLLLASCIYYVAANRPEKAASLALEHNMNTLRENKSLQLSYLAEAIYTEELADFTVFFDGEQAEELYDYALELYDNAINAGEYELPNPFFLAYIDSQQQWVDALNVSFGTMIQGSALTNHMDRIQAKRTSWKKQNSLVATA